MSERSQGLPIVSLELPNMKWIVSAMVAGAPLVGALIELLVYWFTGVFHPLTLLICLPFGIAMACGFTIAVGLCRLHFVKVMHGCLDQIKVNVEHQTSATQDQLRAGFNAQVSAAHERGVESGRREALEGLAGQEFVIPAQCPHGATFVVVLRFGAFKTVDDDPGADSPTDTVVN